MGIELGKEEPCQIGIIWAQRRNSIWSWFIEIVRKANIWKNGLVRFPIMSISVRIDSKI